MFGHVVIELTNTLLVYLSIVGVVSNQSCKTILPLQCGDLLVKCLDLIIDEFAYAHGFFSVINLQFLVLSCSISKQLLLVNLKQSRYFFDDFLFIFQ
jgi:hypothetical protein